MASNRKLVTHYGLSVRIVALLHEGGFHTPAQIRVASDDDLLTVLTAEQLATLKASKIYR